MFWSSKALPWLIPNIMLAAPISSTVVIVSPWIEDVALQVSRWEGQRTLEGIVNFSEVLRWLKVDRRLDFVIYVRTDQLRPALNPRIAALEEPLRGIAQFRGIDNLHAKMLVTDTTVLETSANLLTRSLYTNVETVTLTDNLEASSNVYMQEFLARHGAIVTGRI